MAAFHNTDCGAHPGSDLFLYFFRCPVSDYHFAYHTHAGYDMSKFTVAVCRLVLVHKIHVDGIVWNLFVELGMQMQQRFPVFLQSQDPGFCRGEGMHPGDHAGTFFVCICLIKGFTDDFVCDQGWFPYHFVWQDPGFIQFVYDNLGMFCYFLQTLISVQIL